MIVFQAVTHRLKQKCPVLGLRENESRFHHADTVVSRIKNFLNVVEKRHT